MLGGGIGLRAEWDRNPRFPLALPQHFQSFGEQCVPCPRWHFWRLLERVLFRCFVERFPLTIGERMRRTFVRSSTVKCTTALRLRNRLRDEGVQCECLLPTQRLPLACVVTVPLTSTALVLLCRCHLRLSFAWQKEVGHAEEIPRATA